MKFIQKVSTNLKVGADVVIGEKTLIVGRNGGGKSTIINAIELALTNRVSDVAGRIDVGREADVMSLSPSNDLEALAVFDDGGVSAYRTSGSTAKAKKATGDKPSFVRHDDVLPIRSLREAVLGSPVTARKYLMGKACGVVSRGDVKAMLAEQVRPLWDKLAAATDSNTPTPDVLVEVLEAASKQQRAASDEAKAARNAAKLVSGSFSTPPSDDEIKRAKKEVTEAKAAFVAASRAKEAAEKLQELASSEAELLEQMESAAKALTAAKTALDNNPERPTDKVATLKAIKTVGDESLKAGLCLVCNGDVSQAGENMNALEWLIGDLLASEKEHATLVAAHATAHAHAKTVYEKLLAVQQQIEQGTLLTTGETDPVAAEARLDEANKALSSLTAARDNWNVVQRSESIALDAERRMEEWRNLKDGCEAAMAVVLDKALATFIAKVQARLPATDIFGLRLRDGEREVLQFGLERDGKLHTALSGAEWARVMAAMAEACVADDQYACIIPEERAFDPDTLTDVLSALGSCKHQVVIASPVKPTKVPKGWTVVQR